MKLDLNNLYGAWFNMSQQKVVVNLALKYTHEMRPESYESLKYLKLHYFPRHMGHSRKKQHLVTDESWAVVLSVHFWSKIPIWKLFLTSLNFSFFDWFGRYASVVKLFAQSHFIFSLYFGSADFERFFREKWVILR